VAAEAAEILVHHRGIQNKIKSATGEGVRNCPSSPCRLRAVGSGVTALTMS
jgi:hypothetical protein